jgi:hypothetical protein
LPIEHERLVESTAVEVVEHDALGRRVLDAVAAAHDHDAPAAVAHLVQQRVHQCKVAEMIDEKLQLDPAASLQSR